MERRNFEEPNSEREISPEEVEFLQDTLRVAEVVVRVQGDVIVKLEKENEELRVLKGENEKLRKERTTDDLTGAANAVGFHESLDQRKTEAGAGFVLMYLDANRFKPINDTFGHEAGDFVLKEIAKYLQGLVRSGDVVARLHGDEFAIIFSGATEEGLRGNFENKKLEFTVDYKGQPIDVSLSWGLAAHKEGETIEELVKRADEAMYVEKKKRVVQ